MKITKFEAARRQLVTSIRLFFEDADSISVYTLGHAAWEVLDALCKHEDKIRFREQMAGANKLTEVGFAVCVLHEVLAVIGEDVLEDFDDDLNDHVLIAATMDFGTLASTKPMEIQLYPIWYFAAHPEKIALPDFKPMQDAATDMFPDLTALDRQRQKAAGLQALVQALRDRKLMTHPSTDRSSVRAIASRKDGAASP